MVLFIFPTVYFCIKITIQHSSEIDDCFETHPCNLCAKLRAYVLQGARLHRRCVVPVYLVYNTLKVYHGSFSAISIYGRGNIAVTNYSKLRLCCSNIFFQQVGVVVHEEPAIFRSALKKCTPDFLFKNVRKLGVRSTAYNGQQDMRQSTSATVGRTSPFLPTPHNGKGKRGRVSNP